MPLHADIMVRARSLGLDALTPILWFKIANGVTEAKGNGSGFYGKPYQPGAIIKNDAEYILFLRKGGEYRSPSSIQKALSMLTKDEMKSWLRSAWVDIKGESTRRGHPAPPSWNVRKTQFCAPIRIFCPTRTWPKVGQRAEPRDRDEAIYPE